MYFVTFDLAKKLKEKGFPQVKKNTLAMYNEEGEWFSLAATLDDYEYSFEDFDEHDCVCPTISQVLKWLREEENIHIQIGYRPNTLWRIVVIYTNIYIGAVHTSSKYNSYEEAAIAGIEYVLDNLI